MASDLWVNLTDSFIQPIEPYTDLRCTKQFLPNDVDIWKHQNKHAHTPTGARPILKSPPHTYVHIHGNDNRRNKWRWHSDIKWHSEYEAYSNKSWHKLCEMKQNQR